jgi:hypothetical protein
MLWDPIDVLEMCEKNIPQLFFPWALLHISYFCILAHE